MKFAFEMGSDAIVYMKIGSGIQRFIGRNTFADTETRRQQCDCINIYLKVKKVKKLSL
jgi:hypothetical protein